MNKRIIFVVVWLLAGTAAMQFTEAMRSPATSSMVIESVNGTAMDHAMARSSTAWYNTATWCALAIVIGVPLTVIIQGMGNLLAKNDRPSSTDNNQQDDKEKIA
jgi:hypothetical protein